MAGEAMRFRAAMDTTDFRSGAKAMQDIAARTSANVANHFAKMAGAVVALGAAFMGIRSAAQAFNAAIAMGGQLNELSARTGETAGNLAILQRAFQNAGAGADSVGPTINRLQRAIVEAGQGGKEQAEAFGKLGLSFSDLKTKTPTEQLQSVGIALARVSTDSDRSALAMQLLGRSGGELIPLLRAMGVELDIARSQLGSTPEVMDRVASILDTVGDNFAAIGEKGKEFAAGLLERLAPALAEITGKIANIDAAGFGRAVSGYIEQTLKWVNASLGLSVALENIRTAINGIMAGRFGDGLSLMFMTARDTAFNAINQIVAAAQAAISTLTGAVAKMFDANGALILLLKTSFTIAANYFKEVLYSALADFMDAIGRSGMADTFRYQAETAARSIEMLTIGIGSQIELVGEQAKETFGGIPKAFKDSYAANMKDPLIDMRDRTAETAEQAEKLRAAVRAASFDAKTFGDNMARAREEMLAGAGSNPLGGQPETGETGMAVNPDNRKFSWQGAGPSGPSIDASGTKSAGGGGSRGGAGGRASAPQTALEQLRQRAETDVSAAAQLSRIAREQSRAEARAADYAERGRFFSAANTEMRARQRAERRASERNALDLATDRFGGRNMSEAYRNYLEELRDAGMSTLKETQKDFEKWAREQSKTESERQRQSETASRAAGVEPSADPIAWLSSEVKLIREILTKPDGIHDRLPIRVLAA